MTTVVECLDDPARLVEAMEHFPDSTENVDRIALEHFLTKLRHHVESGSQLRLQSAAVMAVCRLLATGPRVAKEISNQGFHEVLLQRVVLLDFPPEEAEVALVALALFMLSEPTAFVQANGVAALVKVLRRFHGVAFIQEWVSKGLYILHCRIQPAEKVATIVNRFGSDLVSLLEIAPPDHFPTQWSRLAFFVAYLTSDAQQRSSLLLAWEQLDQDMTAMKLLLLKQDFEPFSTDMVWVLLDDILRRNPVFVDTITDPCILRSSEKFQDSISGILDNSIPILASLNLFLTILEKSKCRKHIAGAAAEFALRLLRKSTEDDAMTVASTCMWILWNLSEGVDELTLENVQASCICIDSLLRWRNCCHDSSKATTLLLHVFGFINCICSFPGLDPKCIPLDLIVSAALLPGDTSHLIEVEAIALSNLFSMLPDSIVALHAPSIVSRIVNDLERETLSTLSLLEALCCLASSTQILKSGPLKADVLAAVAQMFSSRFNDETHLVGLDLVSCVTAQDTCLTIPQGLWDGVAMLGFLARYDAVVSRANLCFRALCSASEKPPNLKLIGMRLSESLGSDSLREQRISACLGIWSLTTSHNIEDRFFLSTIHDSLLAQLRGLLQQYSENDQRVLYDPEVVLALSQALAAIAFRTTVPLRNDEAQTLVELTYCIMSNERETAPALDFLLLCFLHFCTASSTELVECGVIVAVIDAMDEFDDDQAVQEKGCALLALLSASRSLQVVLSIVQTEGIDVLLEAQTAFPNNKVLQCDVCKAITNLSIDREARLHILSQGGVFLLMLVMSSNKGSIELQEHAVSALLRVLSDEETSIDGNVVEAALEVMDTFPHVATLQESFLSLFRWAMSRPPDCKTTLANERGAEAVLRALSLHVSLLGIVRPALEILPALDSVRAKNSIVELGGVHLIINGILSHIENGEAVLNGCRCLTMLSTSPGVSARICQDGGVKALTCALWAHYKCGKIVNEIFAVLASLVGPNLDAEESTRDAVIFSMIRFQQQAGIQTNGCRILSGCLLSSKNRTVLLAKRSSIEHALTQATRTFPELCTANATSILSQLNAGVI